MPGGRSIAPPPSDPNDATGTVISTGQVLGDDNGLHCPDTGRPDDDPGHFAMALKPRCVAAVPHGAVLVRGAWAREVLRQLPAKLEDKRSVCTPFVTAVTGA